MVIKSYRRAGHVIRLFHSPEYARIVNRSEWAMRVDGPGRTLIQDFPDREKALEIYNATVEELKLEDD
jgi:uncharacterized protein (DUF1330 family)